MCRALREQGIDVLLATTDDGAGRDEQVGLKNGVEVVRFPVQAGSSFKYSRPFASWLHANVSGFDLVHIHAVFNHASIAAARACRKNGVPYVVRPLGTLDPWSMSQKPLRKKIFWHAGIRRLLSEAAAIHYTSAEEQKAVEQSLGLNHGRIVPLGVDSFLEGAPGGQSSLRAPASLLDSATFKQYVLVLSRLHPKKGLDVLIRAFLSLIAKDEFRDLRLVLAGTGEEAYVDSLKLAAKNHPSIVFVGWVGGDDKDALLRNASLLALPSYQENFGVCVLESLAVGTPVVVSPQVNLAKQVESAGAGWIADINELKLEQVLAEALRNHEERERRGAAGKRFAQDFTWPAVAAQLIEMYEAVVEGGASAKHGRDARATYTPTMLEDITPLILTFNESANIGRTLDQLTWAQDIVIVDSFSSDDTLEIASRYPQTRVFQRKFDDFASQCNFGLTETGIKTQWVLSLDSDYVLTSELIDELGALSVSENVAGLRASFTYCIYGRKLRSGIYPPVTVLFRKSKAIFRADGHAHRVSIDGELENLRAPILHDDRKPLSRWFEAQSRYTKLEAEKLADATPSELTWTDRIRRWRVIAPPGMLVYCLILRGGLLDGWAGFYYAFQRALAELMLSLYLLDHDLTGSAKSRHAQPTEGLSEHDGKLRAPQLGIRNP